MIDSIDPDEFERLVIAELDLLPDDMMDGLENVSFTVEDVPEDGSLHLLGLYHGIALTHRGNYGYGELPDRITLYRKPLLAFSHDLDDAYFGGLTSETYNPTKNRFEKRRNAPRNEPLDTWVYAYAAALHPELRLNRWTGAQWDARAAQLLAQIERQPQDSRGTSGGDGGQPLRAPPPLDSRETSPSSRVAPRRRGVETKDGWGL